MRCWRKKNGDGLWNKKKSSISQKAKAVTFQFQASFLECCRQEEMEAKMKIPFTFEGKLLQFDIKGPNLVKLFVCLFVLETKAFQEKHCLSKTYECISNIFGEKSL